MEVEHLEHTERDLEISKARALNIQQPTVPNTTKVVRLFVLPRNRDLGRPMDNKDFGHTSPGRTDVFVVITDAGLKPMSWLGGKLVDHERAHHEHVGTVVVLKGAEREQIEWQCDVPFRVTDITPLDTHQSIFPTIGEKMEYPFIMSKTELQAQTGDKDRPIRSGPTKPGEWSRLYKADFKLSIEGVEMDFDPDFYCDHN